MKRRIFDPGQQQGDLSSKISTGLERISEVFKVLLWDKAKRVGLSPIQIQVLIFIAYHKSELCNVSHLAREFNVTKPTISDAVKLLDQKKLIVKDFSPADHRSYQIHLSASGKKIVSQTEDFADPLRQQVGDFSQTDLKSLFQTLSELIYKLNQNNVLTVQRTCFGCRFYEKRSGGDYCNFLREKLQSHSIRLDCPEFETRE